MSLTIPVAVVLLGGAYLFWRTFRYYFISLPIDVLPGPPSTSFWLGTCVIGEGLRDDYLTVLCLGNLSQFGERQSWRYWERYAETYGPAFVMGGILGVSLSLILATMDINLCTVFGL